MLLDDGTGKKEPRVGMPVRMTESLADYVRERAGWKKVHGKWQKGAGELTRVIEDAVELHRHLHRTLSAHRLRLQRAALDEGLEFATHAPDVLSKLVLLGLEAAEKQRK